MIMVIRIGGSRRKSRHKMSKNVREKGKIKLVRYFQKFSEGDRICLLAEPSIHKSIYHARFHGKVGKVLGKRGKCYEVQIKDINKLKKLIVHPVHLKKV